MTTYEIADLIIGIVLCVLIFALVVFIFKKKTLWLVFGLELVGFSVCFYFHLNYAAYVIMGFFIISALVACFANIGDIRGFVANPLQNGGKVLKANTRDFREYDREKVNKAITQAVKWLSDNRTGALITFERNTSLDKYIESGTVLNAPVTSELIETIFFEGTRLHDGAVIIRKDVIVAAACFFPATTRTLVGKYGARHRAALGISEITDSVTVIVSEETGRISIAYNGTLEPIKYDEFEKVFATFMLAPSGTTTLSSLSKSQIKDNDNNIEAGN